jgi:hypothetical protein
MVSSPESGDARNDDPSFSVGLNCLQCDPVLTLNRVPRLNSTHADRRTMFSPRYVDLTKGLNVGSDRAGTHAWNQQEGSGQISGNSNRRVATNRGPAGVGKCGTSTSPRELIIPAAAAKGVFEFEASLV